MPKQKIDPRRLAEMWAAGRTVAEIQVAFGVCRQAVRERVRRLGLPPRFKGWHPAGYSERMSKLFKEKYRRFPRERR